ncbi:MAG: hypothetical protein ACLFV4_00245 [Candidatus Hydrogenedentota bacterium]
MRWTKYVVLAGLAGVLALGSRSAHGEETFEPAGLLLTWQQDPLTTMTIDWRSYEERDSVPHVFPNYHVPAYPSHRSYDGGVQTQVRENWVPLFEGNNVQVAFENHDHAYKRTYPIRDGEISSGGIVYLGDGRGVLEHAAAIVRMNGTWTSSQANGTPSSPPYMAPIGNS